VVNRKPVSREQERDVSAGTAYLLAVPEAPRDVGLGGDSGGGGTDVRAAGSGIFAWPFARLGIVEEPLRMVRPRDSKPCHAA
jgi:hypothetical protein